jgi:Tfp pilus assembly protein PilW
MKKAKSNSSAPSPCEKGILKESGFALTEFLISTVVILLLSAGVFNMLIDVQGTSGYQQEVLSVMENTRVAMSILERIVVQAGNNPRGVAFTPVTINGSSEVRICADLTGGSQGDPDGDISDANEDITIRLRSGAIELVDGANTVQTLAQFITALNLQYLDANGTVTTNGADVRTISVTISGASAVANPRTGHTFGQTLTGVFTLPNRG